MRARAHLVLLVPGVPPLDRRKGQVLDRLVLEVLRRRPQPEPARRVRVRVGVRVGVTVTVGVGPRVGVRGRVGTGRSHLK